MNHFCSRQGREPSFSDDIPHLSPAHSPGEKGERGASISVLERDIRYWNVPQKRAPAVSEGNILHISRAKVCGGASSASNGIKPHFPRSWRNTKKTTSDSRSRSPLSIRALRSARDPREGRRTTFGSIYRFKIYRSGLASARLVQDDGSRKLPLPWQRHSRTTNSIIPATRCRQCVRRPKMC